MSYERERTQVIAVKGTMVSKRLSGRRVKFNVEKLRLSVSKAVLGAGLSNEDVEDIVVEVLKSIEDRGEVSTREISDLVEKAMISRIIRNPKWEEAAKRYLLARIYNQVYGKGKWKDFDPKDLELTYNALKLLEIRYLLKDPETGRIKETPQMLFRRVARHLARVEYLYGKSEEEVKKIEDEFYRILSELRFIPNSPTLMNAETRLGILSACFVIPVRDALTTPDGEGIMDAVRATALIQQQGGGTGFDFSELRPKGDMVASTAGVASGPLSFMKLFDTVTDVIKQGGRRRGANMGVMHVWHPDIEEFIKAKTGEAKERFLQNFNISVGVYDKFMEAVLEGREWRLVNPRKTFLRPGEHYDSRYYAIVRARHSIDEEWVQEIILDELEEHDWTIPLDESLIITLDEAYAIAENENAITKTVNARQLFYEIVKGAWEGGDPGMLFMDEINRRHPVWYLGKITATNPCVSGDTRILTPQGWKTAKEVYEEAKRNSRPVAVATSKDVLGEGGEPYAYPTRIVVPGGIVAKAWVWRIGRKPGIRVRTETGREITVTHDHKFSVKRLVRGEAVTEWVEAKNIRVGDLVEVVDDNGRIVFEKIVLVEDAGIREFYDFTVPVYHKYIANGFVNHNCGEEPLLPWENCNLGSLNLEKYVVYGKDGEPHVDWEGLARDIRVAVRFLDNVIDANKHPLKQIEEANKRTRKIGLGVMGWAHMLVKLGIRYDSVDAVYLAYHLAEWIAYNAYLASIELAMEKGVFPAWNPRLYRPMWWTARSLTELLETAGIEDKPSEKAVRLVAERPEVNWGLVEKLMYEHGLRNAALLSIAPTGSISIIAGTTSSIEPIFALAFMRHVSVGTFLEVDRLFLEYLRRYEMDEPELIEEIAKTGSIAHLPFIPRTLKKLFRTAHDIEPVWHILHQAAWQQWIDAAVSKTINMRYEASVEDVWNAYILAWKLGCKGITVYRDKSRREQVIYFGLKTQEKEREKKEKAEVEKPVIVKDMRTRAKREQVVETRITPKRFRIGKKEYIAVSEEYAGGCPTCDI